MTIHSSSTSRLTLCAEIVTAYLSNNTTSPEDIPALIRETYAALGAVGQEQTEPVEKRGPAVPIRRSLTPDYIVSLEDGRHYKSLKRHLAVNGLTPMTYRQKWGLPLDYPMVAPNYAKQRSDLARAIGLGRRPDKSGGERSQRVRNGPRSD